ncbi:hypothetical protein LTR56_023972 [Elasticomyces elasticus]|nr:hypothetical protein LTR56_023972 [Elasticomyces elasticus]KAK3634637.1 hypothetical protein LTR22_019530 [Elasticomyces elasticus]KAK4911325.1 hypothetical protein LTR49_020062 [Elasticomyces elasticus]KAK5758210.1 hypothetical protein LTS12_011680 [Elasticomyces elasticus]
MANNVGPLGGPGLFEQILRDFRDSLTTEEDTDFAATTLDELKLIVTAIQEKQRRKHNMQNMTRLMGFLEAMENYGKTLDVFVNVHNFVAFIWGPMKFLLLVASSFAEAFNALLDAYQRIAEQLPLLAQVQALFGDDIKMRDPLATMYRDIFVFHRRALKYFKGTVWKQLFQATWKQFNTSFGSLLEDMRQHKVLVETQASLLEFGEAKKARLLDRLQDKTIEDRDLVWRKQFILNWLSAPDPAVYQEKGQFARKASSNSGVWLLKKDLYRVWRNVASNSAQLLWVNGKPGAGKTVLASLVVDELQKANGAQVLYFYLRQGDEDRQSFLAMARSLLQQAIKLNNDPQLLVYIFDEATKSTETNLRTTNLAEHLLDACLSAIGKIHVVIDGLDECSGEQQRQIATWAKRFVEKSAQGPEPSRCLFFSQADTVTRPLLSMLPTLELTSTDNADDIHTYCMAMAQQVCDMFKLSLNEGTKIASDISQKADGMFLYAKLVMSNLLDQVTKDGLNHEMKADVLPTGLEEAYARILDRLFKDAAAPRQKEVRRLIAWITCATRSLRWQEIQAAISLDFDLGRLDYASRQLVEDAKQLCGALVDELSNGEVVFVHSTVRDFVTKANVVCLGQQHSQLASICLRYLSLPVFETDVEDRSIEEAILDGSYAFVDYAFASWTAHLLTGFDQLNGQDRDLAEEEFGVFLDLHAKEPSMMTEVSQRIFDMVKLFKQETIRKRALLSLASVDSMLSSHESVTEPYEALDLFATLTRIRACFERVGHEQRHKAALAKYYPKNLYKCPRLYCKGFYEGFATCKERDSHKQKHDREYYCPHSGCHLAIMGCATEKELETHVAVFHQQQPSIDDFPAQPDLADLPPPSFPCDQCSKTFTRQSNLKAHQRTHVKSDKPFVCTTCSSRFARQPDLRRHEQSHKAEKQHVCGGILDTGEKWGCGKTYNRADALARHHQTTAARNFCLKHQALAKAVQTSSTVSGSGSGSNTPPAGNPATPAIPPGTPAVSD